MKIGLTIAGVVLALSGNLAFAGQRGGTNFIGANSGNILSPEDIAAITGTLPPPPPSPKK